MLRRAMMAGQYGPVQTVFDPALRDTTITLSNGNRDAAGNSNNAGLALSSAGKSSGKYYAEFELMANSSSSNTSYSAGIRATTTGLNTYLGSDVTAFASWVEGAGRSERSTYNNAIRSNVLTGQGDPSIGVRMRIAVDVGTGLWLSRWGSTVWIGGGDPDVGTSPTYGLAAGTYRLAANPRGMNGRIRLVLPSAWANAAPSGFGVWTAG